MSTFEVYESELYMECYYNWVADVRFEKRPQDRFEELVKEIVNAGFFYDLIDRSDKFGYVVYEDGTLEVIRSKKGNFNFIVYEKDGKIVKVSLPYSCHKVVFGGDNERV